MTVNLFLRQNRIQASLNKIPFIRYRVVTAFMERMTPRYSLDAEPDTPENTELCNRFVSIVGTGRGVTALGRHHCRIGILI